VAVDTLRLCNIARAHARAHAFLNNTTPDYARDTPAYPIIFNRRLKMADAQNLGSLKSKPMLSAPLVSRLSGFNFRHR